LTVFAPLGQIPSASVTNAVIVPVVKDRR
jgi:hypothetical protein